METVKICKFVWNVLEFGRALNYTPGDTGITTWGYRAL